MNNFRKGAKRYIIFAVFTIVAVISAILFGKVGINYDITKYLDDDTETKISLEIIENEFGMTGNVQVMVENIEVNTASDFAKRLGEIENVLTVSFDPMSETSYKNGKALFNVLLNGSDSSDEAKKALELMDIDEKGLDFVDKRVLMAMIEKFGGGPVGLDTLSATTNEEVSTIEDIVEPYLLQLGFVVRTNRGRCVTKLAYEHFGLPVPKSLRVEESEEENND